LAAVGGSDEDAALASGITDELILRLRRIEGLRIASARADGSAPSAEFENAHAMEGSIRRSGESLRTTIRLLDPSGAVLWSETYDRTINELLQVQEETAAAIANALSVSLDVGVNSRQYGGTNNPEAFSSYVLGVVNSGDPEAKFRYFQRATELDPNYTQALSALTDAHWGRLTAARSKDEMERILAEADAVSARAFNSRPQNAYSFMARGVYLKMANDLQGGDEMFRRAAELDPGYDPIAKLILASHEQGMGRVAKARRLALAAEQIDPVYRDDPWMTRFLVYSGRYDEAIALSERIGRTDGQVLDAPLTLHAMILAGETRKAREFARNVPSYRRIEALFAEQSGLLAMSREDLRGWAKARYGEGPANELWPMAVSAALGGNDAAAMRFLQVATELSPPGVGLIWHPAFANLRPTKDFKQLVQDVGLDKIWRASGEWGDHCRPLSATDFECS
ncbi:MAG TPA: hypothetical protein VLA37_01945, partial [Sphingomonadaceae bacterium]|nr:hypothetical protein [Sphingomonadaceae bacterium]